MAYKFYATQIHTGGPRLVFIDKADITSPMDAAKTRSKRLRSDVIAFDDHGRVYAVAYWDTRSSRSVGRNIR